MSLSSYIVVMFIAFSIVILGMLYIRKVHKDTARRREIRKSILVRIESSRLPKILQAMGIGFANYFYKVPIEEINKCVDNCDICISTDLCDEKVKFPELNPDDVDFCPNQQHLSQFSRAKRIRN